MLTVIYGDPIEICSSAIVFTSKISSELDINLGFPDLDYEIVSSTFVEFEWRTHDIQLVACASAPQAEPQLHHLH